MELIEKGKDYFLLDNAAILKETQENKIKMKELCKIIFSLERDLSRLNELVVEIMKEYYKKEIIVYNKANNIINEEFVQDDD